MKLGRQKVKELGSQNFTLMNFRETWRRHLFNNKLSIWYSPSNLIFLCFHPLVYGGYLGSALFPCVVEWLPCDKCIFVTFAVSSADTGILFVLVGPWRPPKSVRSCSVKGRRSTAFGSHLVPGTRKDLHLCSTFVHKMHEPHPEVHVTVFCALAISTVCWRYDNRSGL